ncbi:hypothetical protein [Phormidesmis sp. 146-33]
MTADFASGWKDLGSTKDGLWKQFLPDTGATFDRDEWQRRKREEKPVAVPQTMSLDERDRFYIDWLAKGSLNERDRADLERRGVTDFSIALSSEIGYAVPFKGLEGKYVGAQWRYADPGDEGRYRWHNLSGGKYYPSTDEMPIAVCHPTGEPKGIALVEGAGIKPMITAEKLGMVAIGAAGGNHLASPIQLRQIIEAFPGLSIVIIPDAGDVINSHVLKRHKRTAAHFPEAKFLWWGQTTKEATDIDEAIDSEIGSARSLTWAEFEALNPSGKGFGKAATEPSDRQKLIDHRAKKFLRHWDDLKRDFQLPKLIEGVEQFEYEGFCPTLDLVSYDSILVQGWVGAGKTEAMLRSLAPGKEYRAIVAVTPLNGLGRQLEQRAERMGFDAKQYQSDVFINRMMISAGEAGITINCVESLKPYAVKDVNWGQHTLVIDEFAAIRKAISTKAERAEFFRAIAECSLLIVADAFLSAADIALIRKLRGGSMALYRQKFVKSPVRIKWLETLNKQGEISFRHDGIYFDLLRKWIEGGEVKGRIAIATDALSIAKAIKTFVETLKYPNGRSPRVWLACSETVEENAAFMPNPDGIIERASHPIDVVIYTPTAKSGLDIQAPFDRGLLISCGVLSPTDMLQMLGRCRQCLEWWVSAPRFSDANGDLPSLDSKSVKRAIARIQDSFAELGFDAPQAEQGLAVWTEATQAIEKQFNSEYVYALLNEYFESVETVTIDYASPTEWRNAIAQIKQQDAENTLNANLQNGSRLVDGKKQPSRNSEVWDCKLALFDQKYPRLGKRLATEFRDASKDLERKDEILKLFRELNSRRANKLKNWLQAIEGKPEDEIDLSALLRSHRMNYSSRSFKTLQNLKLFRSLNLERLAKLTSKSAKEFLADESAFRVNSSIVFELYREFERDRKLRRLFPLISGQIDLWNAIKKCLKALGFESFGKTIRIESEEMHPNGRNSDGSQRFSPSKSLYFIGWLLMECSGSAFFRENFTFIVEAIRDRLEAEREERRAWRERQESPPDIPIAA